MDSLNIIQFKWDCGVYDLRVMCDLVDNHRITEEQFHEITRKCYKVIKEQISGKE